MEIHYVCVSRAFGLGSLVHPSLLPTPHAPPGFSRPAKQGEARGQCGGEKKRWGAPISASAPAACKPFGAMAVLQVPFVVDLTFTPR